MPLLSVITTCKGRLEHLKASLPALLALPDCEVIVVDYDCPDRARDWVREAQPAARLVCVDDRPLFNAAKARNLGLSAATAPWVLMVDVDMIVAPTLVDELRPQLQRGTFLCWKDPAEPFFGTVVARRDDFAEIGGYDEVFEGWGSEDVDVVDRLAWSGRRPLEFPTGQIRSIRHGIDQRVRFHAIADIEISRLVNGLYRRVKIDLRQLGKPLNEDQRRGIYNQIREAALRPGGLTTIELEFDSKGADGPTVYRSLRYRLHKP